MNRQSRRLKAKEKPVISKDDLLKQLHKKFNKQVEDKVHKAIENTQEWILQVVCLSLVDEFGFSKADIQKFVDKVNNQFECVLEGTVNLEDFSTMCEEEGIL